MVLKNSDGMKLKYIYSSIYIFWYMLEANIVQIFDHFSY